MQNRTISMIGIAAKAGKVVSGEFSTEKAIKEVKAYLVIVAKDASDNTKKKFKNSTDFYKVKYVELFDKDELGRCIGKEFRASIAVTDENLANAILKTID